MKTIRVVDAFNTAASDFFGFTVITQITLSKFGRTVTLLVVVMHMSTIFSTHDFWECCEPNNTIHRHCFNASRSLSV